MKLNLKITNPDGKSSENMQLSDKVFGCEFNEALVHQIVVAYAAASRAGTSSQKTRAEVSGGGKKPWKQKGTGQARAGTTRGPIWRGGGVTFASCTPNYKQKVNKKMYLGAMRAIFSELLRQNRLVLVDSFDVVSHKTKELVAQLKALDLNKVLLITGEVDKNLYFAARNLSNISIRDVGSIDPLSLVGFEKVLVTVPVLKKIEEMLS